MNRRKFLNGYLPAGVMIPSFVNGMGFKAFESGHTFLNNVLLPGGDNDRVFVVIQLNGGNDGLNTIFPLDKWSNLVNARANILMDPKQVLTLSDNPTTGLHPAMTEMKKPQCHTEWPKPTTQKVFQSN